MSLQFPYPAPPPGLDVTLARQQDTGRFDLVFSTSGANKGNPELDQTRTHGVLSALLSKRRGQLPGSSLEQGGYYWDETGRRGSLLWTVTQDRQGTPSQLQAYAQDVGQQLITLLFIRSFTSRAERIGQGKYRLYVQWSTPSSTINPSQTLTL